MTVAVIGAGLAGSLLALELGQRGLPVLLLDAGAASATALSYGAVAAWAAPPTPLGRLMRQAPRRWRGLQRQHGLPGWHRRWLRLHGAGLLQTLPLPCGQVEVRRLLAALPQLLRDLGVRCESAVVDGLARQGQGWRLQLAGGAALPADAVVLAAGAACRQLWPGLSPALRVSWAGVLELAAGSAGRRPGPLRLPARFERIALEQRAAALTQEAWVVDPGLVPWGETVLAGQISLVRPGLEAGPPPDPQLMEQRLRQGLRGWQPALAGAAGRYHQAPVAFCSGGGPLVGPVPQRPGLWQFTGFSAAFAQVPVLAPLLAAAIAGEAAALAQLRSLTGWPDDPGEPPCR